ncbi:MAG: PAS domain S-box protein [Candidatus Xenobiia bacterium LiM19]
MKTEKTTDFIYSILETVKEGLIVTDNDGKVCFCNRRLFQLWQFEDDHAAWKDDSSLFTGITERIKDPSQFINHVEELRQAPELECNETIELKDGRFLELSSSPQIIDGRITGRVWTFHDISSHINAEKEFRHKAEKLRHLAENSIDMLFCMTLPEGRYEYISSAVTELTGYPPEEYYQHPRLIAEVVHPDWREYLETNWKNLMLGSAPPFFEFQITHRSGEVRWVNQMNTLVRDADGTPVALEGIVSDITDRKRAEEALIQSKELYRTILDNMHDVVYSYSPEQKITFISDSVRLYGYEPAEVLGSSMLRFIHPDDLTGVEQDISDRIRSGEDIVTEKRVLNKSGEIQFVEVTGRVVKAPSGRTVNITGLIRNITDKKKAEEAQKESERRYYLMLKNSHDITLIMDEKGAFTYLSESFERLTGYTIQVMLGRSAFEFIHPDDIDTVTELFQRIMEKPGSSVKSIHRYLHRDGAYRYFEVLATNMTGEPLIEGILMNARDITESYKAQEELRKAMVLADTANRAKSAFLAKMSHEIRTPMTGILGTTELLLDTQLSVEQKDYLNLAKTSARNLLDLINNILDLARIESGKMELQKRVFSLEKTVSAVMKLLKGHAAAKGIELLCQIDDGVPDALIGDSQRLNQILINQFANALRFTEKGSITVTVRKERQEGEQIILHFTVEDTGCGIPPEKRDLVFEPFTQVEQAQAMDSGGSGLGLSICKELVTLMKGTIWLESKVGKGCTFHFTQPVVAGQKEQIKESAPVQVAGEVRPMSIIIAEDEVINRRVIVDYLKKQRHTVTAAGSGEAVLSMLDERDFEMILMDIHMSGMDGLEATRQIREKEKETGKHIPIIALTAYAMSNDRERFLEAGMDNYLSKPVEFEDLDEIIMETAQRFTRQA